MYFSGQLHFLHTDPRADSPFVFFFLLTRTRPLFSATMMQCFRKHWRISLGWLTDPVTARSHIYSVLDCEIFPDEICANSWTSEGYDVKYSLPSVNYTIIRIRVSQSMLLLATTRSAFFPDRRPAQRCTHTDCSILETALPLYLLSFLFLTKDFQSLKHIFFIVIWSEIENIHAWLNFFERKCMTKMRAMVSDLHEL